MTTDGAPMPSRSRLIDDWFPVAAVDEACGTPAGSGRNEKALFTWFASRPTAQARAAVLGAVLGADADHDVVDRAVRLGDPDAVAKLAEAMPNVDGRLPAMLDCFSGRGIIPLEAARFGLRAVGVDLSPVAVLGSRLLADWPLRDWSSEPASPFTDPSPEAGGGQLFDEQERPRLVADVEGLLAEVGRRASAALEPYFPTNPDGSQPWGTLWAITIPCDACGRRFPLIGSMKLRAADPRNDDPGQSLELVVDERAGRWHVAVCDGVTDAQSTFLSRPGSRGKVARCPFRCGIVHPSETIKAKGFAGQYADEPVLVADLVSVPRPGGGGRALERKVFRPVRDNERAAISRAAAALDKAAPFGDMPAEPIPPGNEDTVRRRPQGQHGTTQERSDRAGLARAGSDQNPVRRAVNVGARRLGL